MGTFDQYFSSTRSATLMTSSRSASTGLPEKTQNRKGCSMIDQKSSSSLGTQALKHSGLKAVTFFAQENPSHVFTVCVFRGFFNYIQCGNSCIADLYIIDCAVFLSGTMNYSVRAVDISLNAPIGILAGSNV